MRASGVQGSRVGVRTPPQGAGAQSRPGSLPGCGAARGGGPRRSPDVQGSASRLHAGRPGDAAGQSPRARGGKAGRGTGTRGPPWVPAPQVGRGALRGAAPPGAGEEDGSRRGGEPGGWWGRGPRATPGGLAPELRPLARGRRSGREAPGLTSRGPAGDGGSGHSTPHQSPPRRPLTAASDVTAHGAGPPVRGMGARPGSPGRRPRGWGRGARGRPGLASGVVGRRLGRRPEPRSGERGAAAQAPGTLGSAGPGPTSLQVPEEGTAPSFPSSLSNTRRKTHWVRLACFLIPELRAEHRARERAWGPRRHLGHPHSSDCTAVPQGLHRGCLLAVTAVQEAREPSRPGRQDPPWPRGLQGDQTGCKNEKNRRGRRSGFPSPPPCFVPHQSSSPTWLQASPVSPGKFSPPTPHPTRSLHQTWGLPVVRGWPSSCG